MQAYSTVVHRKGISVAVLLSIVRQTGRDQKILASTGPVLEIYIHDVMYTYMYTPTCTNTKTNINTNTNTHTHT